MPAPFDPAPFVLCAADEQAPAPRSVATPEGVGDRLRAAAFAELQAREAFLWAADAFCDASDVLRREWRALASAEDRHLGWLLGRMAARGEDPAARPVSGRLWAALTSCASAEGFEILIAKAEERGRLAGERFRTAMLPLDPESAAVFGRIADEEAAHVELARRHYPASAAAAGLS
ncbi:MAG: hypothetical protein HYZ75_19500 [Elusimicrobia bacterium]|nr:hypothetical protein [Elusimicrobiota bacterium]